MTTETTAKARRSGPLKDAYCSQHHCPRPQCPPGSAHGHTHRFHDEIYARLEQAADRTDATATLAIERAMEAYSDGVRCRRCDRRDPASPPVPVIWGDLTGKPLAGWVTQAMEEAVSQHPDHEPVRVGAAAPAVRPGTTVLWQEPGATPVMEVQVPEARAKKGRVRT